MARALLLAAALSLLVATSQATSRGFYLNQFQVGSEPEYAAGRWNASTINCVINSGYNGQGPPYQATHEYGIIRVVRNKGVFVQGSPEFSEQLLAAGARWVEFEIWAGYDMETRLDLAMEEILDSGVSPTRVWFSIDTSPDDNPNDAWLCSGSGGSKSCLTAQKNLNKAALLAALNKAMDEYNIEVGIITSTAMWKATFPDDDFDELTDMGIDLVWWSRQDFDTDGGDPYYQFDTVALFEAFPAADDSFLQRVWNANGPLLTKGANCGHEFYQTNHGRFTDDGPEAAAIPLCRTPGMLEPPLLCSSSVVVPRGSNMTTISNCYGADAGELATINSLGLDHVWSQAGTAERSVRFKLCPFESPGSSPWIFYSAIAAGAVGLLGLCAFLAMRASPAPHSSVRSTPMMELPTEYGATTKAMNPMQGSQTSGYTRGSSAGGSGGSRRRKSTRKGGSGRKGSGRGGSGRRNPRLSAGTINPQGGSAGGLTSGEENSRRLAELAEAGY